jgi:hypothetical protein
MCESVSRRTRTYPNGTPQLGVLVRLPHGKGAVSAAGYQHRIPQDSQSEDGVAGVGCDGGFQDAGGPLPDANLR